MLALCRAARGRPPPPPPPPPRTQTAARTFAAFDPQRTGSITTNFSQFIYCCSHVR